jgi:TolB-like protein/tetratricopeptide (TPR) repeat protein
MSAEKDREPMSAVSSRAATPSGAVFLSYASEDVAAAQRIADALRAAGIEVWFDRSELRGGESWDRQIRRQIHECALFIAVISAHSDARHEGYFRREWRLAVERAGDMAEDVPFLLPVVIDATKDATARVPDRFRDVQWSHLPEGAPSTAFIERVRRLLSPEAGPTGLSGAVPRSLPIRVHRMGSRLRAWIVTAAVAAAVAVGYFAFERFAPKRAVPSAVATVSTPATVAGPFSPPPHSIAVLPFVNMSGDKQQDYFSDGLTEEILNSLARINELQVSARTSSFSFKGEKADLGTIARKLNVAAILEGSVRRSVRRVRVTAQLDDAMTGFRVWSQTYDRDLGDVLELQTELATAVASALKVSLLGDTAARVELGGTRDPAAFDAYLRGLQIERTDPDNTQAVITAQTEAVRLDSRYALAFAARSLALTRYGDYYADTRASSQDAFDKALADARTAIALAPELSEAHTALAEVLQKGYFEFARAREEYEHAVTLAPGNATALTRYGYFAAAMGDANTGIAAAQRAVALDRLNAASYEKLGDTLTIARRFQDALAAFRQALALDPHLALASSGSGLIYYALGDLQSARAMCVIRPDFWNSQVCLSVTYNKLGQQAEAEAMLAKLRAAGGDSTVYQYAQIYAQWGNRSKALEELERALSLRDPGMHNVKTDFLLDPIRSEARFQAIERELKFPN